MQVKKQSLYGALKVAVYDITNGEAAESALPY